MSNIYRFEPRKPKPKPESKRSIARGQKPGQRDALIIVIGVIMLVGVSVLLA